MIIILLASCGSGDNSAPPDGDVDTEANDGDSVDGDDIDGDDDFSEDEMADGVEDAEDEQDTVDPQMFKDIPVANCGMDPYELIDPAQLGEVVDFEEISFWDQDPDGLNSLFESVGIDYLEPVTYGSQVYRYRYTTQDKGEAVEATAMLAIPKLAGKESREFPMVLYTHGTSGFSDPCAPSNPNWWLEGPAVPALFAALGYVVVAPDYIGMNGFGEPATVRHGYLVGEQTAIGSWDAVRAGQRLLQQELESEIGAQDVVVPWGPSQGGQAALYADLYAPYYAPEYEVPATIAIVPPTDFQPLLKDSVLNLRAGTGLLGISMVTMYIWYDRQAPLTEVMSDEEPYYFASRAEGLIFPEDECEIDLDIDLTNASVDMLFSQSFMEKVAADEWDQLEPWQCFYRENSIGYSSVPRLKQTPTLMIYAENDELLATEPLREDFLALCEKGRELDYLECKGAGHVDGALGSLPEQINWLRDRLNGVPMDAETTCTVKDAVCCTGTAEEDCASEE